MKRTVIVKDYKGSKLDFYVLHAEDNKMYFDLVNDIVVRASTLDDALLFADAIGQREQQHPIPAAEPDPEKIASHEPTIREMETLRTHGKIPAIKAFKARTGLGLKESKDLVENAGLRLGLISPDRNGILRPPVDVQAWKQHCNPEPEPNDPIQLRYVVVRDGKMFSRDGIPVLFEHRTDARLIANIFGPDTYDEGTDDPEYEAQYAADVKDGLFDRHDDFDSAVSPAVQEESAAALAAFPDHVVTDDGEHF